MKRRGKGSAQRTTARRRTVAAKARPTRQTKLRQPPAADLRSELQERTRELNDVLEQLNATSEVLHLMSGSHGDLAHVFDTILASAARLCEASFGILTLHEGGAFRVVAMHNPPPKFAELRRREPVIRARPLLRMAATKQFVHVADISEVAGSEQRDPDVAKFIKLTGVRTVLGAPMLKGDEFIGAIVVYRKEVRPFADRQIELLKTFAAQAVIAIENARLLNELRQSLERQTATSEVLRVISSSPGELEPVFATMLENAARVCAADSGAIYRWDGTALHLVATHNIAPSYAEALGRSPLKPIPGGYVHRLVTTKSPYQIADLAAEEAYANRNPMAVAAVEAAGMRTLLFVPLLKEHELIGAVSLSRRQPQLFSDEQIELVKNFAAQAVIAIENTRLLSELRQRTADLTDSLEQQTATAEVLSVINSSPGDLAPVFDAMVEKALRLCQATYGGLGIFEGDHYRVASFRGVVSEQWAQFVSKQVDVQPGSIPDLIRHGDNTVHIPDLAETPPERMTPGLHALINFGKARTSLWVSLHKDNAVLGFFTIYRQEVRPFSEREIDLVQNFAAQAVIAIENARLLNELRQRTTDLTELLEQQTATSEVLHAISGSPGDLKPVFDTIVDNAVRICGAENATLWLYADGMLRRAGRYRDPPDARIPIQASAKSAVLRSLSSRQIIHIPDYRTEQSYLDGDPFVGSAVDRLGIRTNLSVPMLKESEPVGAITIYRTEVRPFTDKQIQLVANFASQAVIAIENARLLRELRQRTDDLTESLEQQTATSEVLRVISSSPGDLAPVFQAILANATRICQAKFGILMLRDGEGFRSVAVDGAPPAYAEAMAQDPYIPPRPGSGLVTLARTKRPVQLADIQADPAYARTRLNTLGGARTLLIVPLLKDDALIGALNIYRQEVRPFTDKQIELVENFAAQAVIAIENARLLNELRQRTEDLTESLEQQTAMSEVLSVISSSPGELEAVFQSTLENALRICQARFGFMLRYDGEAYHTMAALCPVPEYAQEMKRGPLRPDPDSALGLVARTGQVAQIADITAHRLYKKRDPVLVAGAELGGIRTIIAVPMLKDRQLIGAITIFRQEVRPFNDKQIELVKNFAAQAVIAIENARLLSELRRIAGAADRDLEGA